MAAVETPATKLDSLDADPGPELVPIEALLDSEPDPEWVVVDVSEADFTAPEGEADPEAAADAPQVKGSAHAGEREERQDEPSPNGKTLPVNSTRSDVPGPRGCWALNRDGDPCGAARLRSGDYCLSHSGGGIAADPRKFAPLGQEARKRNHAVRAQMRLALGTTRSNSPRAVLRARAFVEAERLAGRVVDAALDEKVPAKDAGRLALALIREVDPAPEVTVSVGLPASVDDVGKLGWAQLQALAQGMGIETNPSPPALTE